MNIIMNFHQMESTPAIKERIEKKSEKLKKFFDGAFEVKWTLSAGKQGHHSHATLTGDRLSVNADSVRDDLYKTFDEVVSKLEKQLSKIKETSKDHIHHKKARESNRTNESDSEF